MDSVPSSLPFVTRDGSPEAAAIVEDDGAMSVATGLAKEASLLFQAGRKMDCLRILKQLLLKKENDPKVHHNIAIAENFQDGCSDPRRLIEVLENIQQRSEELTHRSEEHLEVPSNDGRNPTVKENNNAAHQFSRSDDFDTSVVVFNLAVVWFHLHDYTKSFACLDTLYQNIEPLDEGTALRICLLLLDVALLSHHASRSADVISYMEKVFCVNSQTESGASAHQQSSLALKSTLLQSNSITTDSSQSSSIVEANTFEEGLEDEPLQLLSSLDISGQNLQRRSGIAQSDESFSVVDLRLKLHFYKVRFLILTRNLKAAKREVKMAMNLARGKDYPLALYLKAQLEYARKNHRKAIKLLMASNEGAESGISGMYYNNLGCIYYQLGKHHTSGVFFSKAVKSYSLVRKEKPPKLVTLSQDKSLLISYNCGVHLLACGRPIHAARCFQKASLIFYNRPLLWLRIAECCLMAFEKGLITSSSSASDIRVNVIGKGKWRHLALSYGNSSNGEYVSRNDDLFAGDVKQAELSISLARQCLFNALYLLESYASISFSAGSPKSTEENESIGTTHKSGDIKESNLSSRSSQVNSNGEPKDQKSGDNQSAALQNFVTDYDYKRLNENRMVKQVVLADLAYIELALGDPLKALSTAKSLLELPECSRIYVFLGTMYAAEALCLLNRTMEATELLMKYVSVGKDVDLPYTLEDCEKCNVENMVDNEDSRAGTIASHAVFSSPEEARGIILSNFAANFALQGDIEQAQHFAMKALSDVPKSPQAILTAVYLDLKCGRTQDALAKLKHHDAVRFLPGDFKLNGS